MPRFSGRTSTRAPAAARQRRGVVAAAVAHHDHLGQKAPRAGDDLADGRPTVEGGDHCDNVFTTHESATYNTAVDDPDLLFSAARL